jgi:hypothetical protein
MTRLLIAVLSLLAFVPGANGQVIWKLKHSDVWKSTDSTIDSSICFTSVSCSGNNCTAAGIVIKGLNYDIKRITFYRSTDAGISWKEQSKPISLPPIITNFGITKMQQIDSLNVVGIGDLGVVVRTFDGGKTWEKQNQPNSGRIIDVHFSDPLTGIIAIADTTGNNIVTTSDGGKHWIIAPFGGTYLEQCHSYGNGKFRLFKRGHGPIYTTYDNFKTIDSTLPVFDSLSDPKNRYLLVYCTFSEGDTILAYSKYWPKDTNNIFGGYGLIMRSIDGGNHWEHPFIYPTIQISQVDYTTRLDRDTICASGISNYNFLISTDRGATWNVDTIKIDTNYLPNACFGLTMTGDGHPIGIFAPAPFVSQSILTRGEFVKSHVEAIERIMYYTYLYPNPTSGLLTIESIDKSNAPIRIIDIWGREIMHGVLSDQGKLTLDFSKLSKGVYDVLLNHFGKVFSVGKVAVVGK